jgi:hypothetical protein
METATKALKAIIKEAEGEQQGAKSAPPQSRQQQQKQRQDTRQAPTIEITF